jgi:hypothetical protein
LQSGHWSEVLSEHHPEMPPCHPVAAKEWMKLHVTFLVKTFWRFESVGLQIFTQLWY